MQLIQGHLHHGDEALPAILLQVPRLTLAKRRWRATAEDGTEFGFDLTHPLEDGDLFHQSAQARYRIAQLPEPVLELPLPTDPGAAARLGWTVGNLHFLLEVTPTALRLPDDSALRQLCDREHLHYHPSEQVFHPMTGGHSHEH